MKTMETTPSGADKDRFHFSMDTEEWNELSQSGVSAGYGARFAVLASRPPRDIRVAYTQPNSPATHPDAAFLRGTKILAIDGVDAVHAPSRAEVDVLNAGLFPSELGEDHEFTVLDPGSSLERTVTLRSASITSDPVQHVRTIETRRRHRGLPPVPRPHRDGRETPVRFHHRTCRGRGRRPRAGHSLQRRRLHRHRQPARLHDRRRFRRAGPRVQRTPLQRQAHRVQHR